MSKTAYLVFQSEEYSNDSMIGVFTDIQAADHFAAFRKGHVIEFPVDVPSNEWNTIRILMDVNGEFRIANFPRSMLQDKIGFLGYFDDQGTTRLSWKFFGWDATEPINIVKKNLKLILNNDAWGDEEKTKKLVERPDVIF